MYTNARHWHRFPSKPSTPPWKETGFFSSSSPWPWKGLMGRRRRPYAAVSFRQAPHPPPRARSRPGHICSTDSRWARTLARAHSRAQRSKYHTCQHNTESATKTYSSDEESLKLCLPPVTVLEQLDKLCDMRIGERGVELYTVANGVMGQLPLAIIDDEKVASAFTTTLQPYLNHQ